MEKKINDKKQCISPFTKKGETMQFNCGKCINCKKRYISGWSFRLMQHLKTAKYAWFVTYTYNTDKVPITLTGRMTLEKEDFQLYMKRLRKAHKKQNIKYYVCGEYGTEKYRPHYHAIMFDVELEHLIGKKLATAAKMNMEELLNGKVQFECPQWGKGKITIGRVSEASIGYCLEYISKPTRIPKYKGDDRVPEFSLKSKYLGINYFASGQKIKSYKISVSNRNPPKGKLTRTIIWRPKKEFIMRKEVQKWHKADLYNRYYSPIGDGKKAALPRYYREKIYTQIERQLIGIQIQKEINDANMTITPQERQKREQSLSAYRVALATHLHKDGRNKSGL